MSKVSCFHMGKPYDHLCASLSAWLVSSNILTRASFNMAPQRQPEADHLNILTFTCTSIRKTKLKMQECDSVIKGVLPC